MPIFRLSVEARSWQQKKVFWVGNCLGTLGVAAGVWITILMWSIRVVTVKYATCLLFVFLYLLEFISEYPRGTTNAGRVKILQTFSSWRLPRSLWGLGVEVGWGGMSIMKGTRFSQLKYLISKFMAIWDESWYELLTSISTSRHARTSRRERRVRTPRWSGWARSARSSWN